jgi:hypothetical protein
MPTVPDEGGGLAGAFEKALADVNIEEAEFQAAAGDSEPEIEEAEPVNESAEPAPAAKPVAAPVKTKPKDGVAQPKAAPAPSQPTLAAPANWDAQRKAAFDKLPPEGKQVLLDTSKGLENEYGNAARYAQAVSSLVTDDHRRQMAAGGFKSEVEGLAHLVKLNDWAAQDFPGYARWAIEQYGRGAPVADTLRQMFPDAFTGPTATNGQAQPAPARPAIDPQTKQVYDTLRQIVQDVHGLKQGNEQVRVRTADQVIAKFRTDADDAGNPKHPHLDQVQNQMADLLRTPAFTAIEDMGQRLQKAYDAAVALDPTIRQQFVDSEVQRRLAEQTKAADLAKARKARAPINSAPTSPPDKPVKGIDGALRQAMNLHGV